MGGMRDFEEEYLAFDQGDHDDMLDALTMVVNDVRDRYGKWKIDYKPMIELARTYKSRLPIDPPRIMVSTVTNTHKSGARLDLATGRWME